MNITGSTRVFMVLGDPVAQVRAPEVYNHLFRRHGVDAVLVPAHVPPAHLAGFVRQVLTARNIEGLWLTIPHKSAVLEVLDHVDATGRVAGAVNAVRRNADGSLEGALFDGLGFVKALDLFGIAITGRRILVLGAGGAGMAIAASLAQRGAGELALFDMTPGRADDVVRRVQAGFAVDARVATSADPAGFDLVVNATPLGLKNDDPLPLDVQRLDLGTAVVDILMKNQPTPLLRACQARGITAHPGYEMLLQQMPEYLSFFGFEAIAQAVQDDPGEVRSLLQPD